MTATVGSSVKAFGRLLSFIFQRDAGRRIPFSFQVLFPGGSRPDRSSAKGAAGPVGGGAAGPKGPCGAHPAPLWGAQDAGPNAAVGADRRSALARGRESHRSLRQGRQKVSAPSERAVWHVPAYCGWCRRGSTRGSGSGHRRPSRSDPRRCPAHGGSARPRCAAGSCSARRSRR